MQIRGADNVESSYPRGNTGAGRRAGKSDRLPVLQDETRIIGKGGISSEYVRRALACEETDAGVVSEMKKLLEGGKLDTDQGAAEAAEKIVSMGI